MKTIYFTKMVASGNDFVVLVAGHRSPVASGLSYLARKMCDRKYGVGADGLLLLEKSKKADIRMRIFNADGSEAEMCGNGARCAALCFGRRSPVAGRRSPVTGRRSPVAGLRSPVSGQQELKLETRAGIIDAVVKGNNVKIKLTEPKDIKIDMPLKVCGRIIKANFINTGVPHTVIFVEAVEKIDVHDLGECIRYHQAFKPKGTNINFVEVINNDSVRVRTYERGVEDETLACGTGSTASALIYALKCNKDKKIKVHTKSSDILSVFFEKKGNKFINVWLEGNAKIVYKGAYYV